MLNNLLSDLQAVGIPVQTRYPARRFSTYKGGGDIQLAAFPQTLEQLTRGIRLFQKAGLPPMVLGGGSNVLVKDGGYPAALFTTMLADMRADGETMVADAGVKLPALADTAAKNALSGLECLAGIPATLGGALMMNAGAFGGTLGTLAESITVYDMLSETTETLDARLVPWGYRSTGGAFQEKIILSARLRLTRGLTKEIYGKTAAFRAARRTNQPAFPSLGCVFKNPAGGLSAGYYIERTGLKGTRAGGAEISVCHANFIINTGGGTAGDYLTLAALAANTVLTRFGIPLEREVIVIGADAPTN